MSTASFGYPGFVERRKRPRGAASRKIFEQLVVSGRNTGTGRKRSLTLPVSIAVHVVVIGAAILGPLLLSQEMPEVTKAGGIRAFFVEPVQAAPPPPPPPPAAKAAAPSAPKTVKAPVKPVTPPKFVAPVVTPPDLSRTQVPSAATALSDLPSTSSVDLGAGVPGGVPGGEEGGVEGGVVGGVVGGVEGGVPGGVVGGIIGGVPKEEPPPAPKGPVRVGGKIKEPTKLKHVPPDYPEIAKTARVTGVVVLEATIDPSGRVRNVRVLRGVPLLNDAAQAAVRQWVYTPTLLNGVPVPVIMTVTVNFTLS